MIFVKSFTTADFPKFRNFPGREIMQFVTFQTPNIDFLAFLFIELEHYPSLSLYLYIFTVYFILSLITPNSKKKCKK